MLTYQDLLAIGDDEQRRVDFARDAINQHRSSALYKTAKTADEYVRHRNTTITTFQKLLYTVSGKAVPDNYSSNYKLSSGFFSRFVTQEVQYLLGNGVTWKNDTTKDRLGIKFDARMQELAKEALSGAVSFGFLNMDHLEAFSVLEFAPVYDEENGALAAGVRFWQVDDDKPLRGTLYEMDGYTDYLWSTKTTPSDKWDKLKDGVYTIPKRPYILRVRESAADGTEIYDGENYPAFPIVPLWGNQNHQSELVGIREQIDCYDLIKSGYANSVDEASLIYWTITNNGGMDDVDLAQFVERIKTVHAANMPADAQAEAHSQEAPYASREALLDRLRRDLYEDYMALDTKEIAAGAVTATQIKAAYEPLNSKVDEFEYCVHDFLDGIMAVLGITDEEPTFTRSKLVNVSEEVTTVLAAGMYLDQTYITEKVLTLLGDGDRVEEVLKRMDADAISPLTDEEPQEQPTEGEETEEEPVTNE